jgi:hypothetical protein
MLRPAERTADPKIERASNKNDAETEETPPDGAQGDFFLSGRVPRAIKVEAVTRDDEEKRAGKPPVAEEPENGERREKKGSVQRAVEQHLRRFTFA